MVLHNPPPSPSPPLSPLPVELTMEAEEWLRRTRELEEEGLRAAEEWLAQEERRFAQQRLEDLAKLEEEKNRLLMAEEMLEQRKRQFEQQLRLREGWAKLEEEESNLAQEKRQFEQECQEDWEKLKKLEEAKNKLQVEAERLAWQRRQFEQQWQEDRAKLQEDESEQLHKLEELDRLRHDLDIREAALKKQEAMLTLAEQLHEPLLVQPEHKNNKNDDTWDLSPIVSVLAVVSGLALLIQMCTLFPLYFSPA